MFTSLLMLRRVCARRLCTSLDIAARARWIARMVETAAPTLLELVHKSGAWLQTRGIDNGRREAEWIFAEALGLTRIELYTRFDMPLDAQEVTRLRALVQRRGRREPLAYVLGTQDFAGVKLQVAPGVLVPRPETEELVEMIVPTLSDGERVLDVGTGSGAIALALKHAKPGVLVDATDASDAALAIARANAQRLTLDVSFHRGHLATHLRGPYAAVIANLPYIGEHERALCDPELAFEPAEALFAPEAGLALMRELIADAPRLLTPCGTLWLEHGFTQAAALCALARVAGLTPETRSDLAGKARFLRAFRAMTATPA